MRIPVRCFRMMNDYRCAAARERAACTMPSASFSFIIADYRLHAWAFGCILCLLLGIVAYSCGQADR